VQTKAGDVRRESDDADVAMCLKGNFLGDDDGFRDCSPDALLKSERALAG
jgi:hypothetical protein